MESSVTPVVVPPKMVFEHLSEDPSKYGEWLEKARPVLDQAKYTYNRPKEGGQKTFYATWFYIVAMFWNPKQEIFGRDGNQEQDMSKFTDDVIDKYLADASEDDRNFLKQSHKELFLVERYVHREVQKDFQTGILAAVASYPLCKAYVENKLRNNSPHDLYIGIRTFYYVKEFICNTLRKHRMYFKNQIHQIGLAIRDAVTITKVEFLNYVNAMQSLVWALKYSGDPTKEEPRNTWRKIGRAHV